MRRGGGYNSVAEQRRHESDKAFIELKILFFVLQYGHEPLKATRNVIGINLTSYLYKQ